MTRESSKISTRAFRLQRDVLYLDARRQISRVPADALTRRVAPATMSDLTADELLKRGDKKMMTTLTRWKPDYEAAAAAYEEAGSKFRAKGRTKDAMLAFEK